MHLIGGSLHVFKQGVWLEVGSGKAAFPRPTQLQVPTGCFANAPLLGIQHTQAASLSNGQIMNKDKLLDFFSKMSFTALVLCWLLGVAGVLPLLWTAISSSMALDSPTLEIGRENSILIIDAIEVYKADHHLYPHDLHDILKYNPEVLDHLHEYDYETYTANYSTQEFMLSFRTRWTIDSWYCYYSGDHKWLQSDSTCWSDPRPVNVSDK